MLWRLGFLVGRTLVGMEVQQVMALADYLAAQPEIDGKKIDVWGEGQGGMTALYAAAIGRTAGGGNRPGLFSAAGRKLEGAYRPGIVWTTQRIWRCRGSGADCAPPADDRYAVGRACHALKALARN